MLPGPVQVDAARAHGLECTLRPQRADVDVPDDESDEEDRHDAVHDLGSLHAEDVRHIEWKHQDVAGYCDRRAGGKGEPEHQLLTGIEAAGCRMPRLDEAAALLEPLDVDPARNVISHPERPDEN